MNHRAVSDVDGNMPAVVNDIAGAHLTGAYTVAAGHLRIGGTGQINAIMGKYLLYKTAGICPLWH